MNILGKILTSISIGVSTAIGIAYVREAFKPEPVHAILPASCNQIIQSMFLSIGFEYIAILEVKKAGAIWGMALSLEGGKSQLHVRAFSMQDNPDKIYLSAHVETHRYDFIGHLSNKSNNELGRQYLLDILNSTGLSRFIFS